jgi:hypothetical protein
MKIAIKKNKKRKSILIKVARNCDIIFQFFLVKKTFGQAINTNYKQTDVMII